MAKLTLTSCGIALRHQLEQTAVRCCNALNSHQYVGAVEVQSSSGMPHTACIPTAPIISVQVYQRKAVH